MNIFSVDAGHNCIPDVGASGVRQEDDLTREVVQALKDNFNQIGGYKLVDCTPYGQKFNSVGLALDYRVKMSDASGATLHLCIHFNAGGGHGVEVYAISATDIARNICNEIAKLGYSNRGVKDGSHLYVVKNTDCKCVLIECCFCDSVDDMKLYNADKFAKAIIKAITGIAVVPKPTAVAYPGYLIQYNPNKFDANVKLIQQKLCIGADGYFGDATLRMVKVFQTSRGLTPDGIVGSLTWNKLFN